MHDHILADISQGKEWEGNYVYNPKTGEPIYLTSRILPYNCHLPRGVRIYHQSQGALDSGISPATSEQPLPISGTRSTSSRSNSSSRSPTHYIYIGDLPSSLVEKSFSSDVASSQDAGYPMPRGSLKSLRKASYDIKSISNDSNELYSLYKSTFAVSINLHLLSYHSYLCSIASSFSNLFPCITEIIHFNIGMCNNVESESFLVSFAFAFIKRKLNFVEHNYLIEFIIFFFSRVSSPPIKCYTIPYRTVISLFQTSQCTYEYTPFSRYFFLASFTTNSSLVKFYLHVTFSIRLNPETTKSRKTSFPYNRSAHHESNQHNSCRPAKLPVVHCTSSRESIGNIENDGTLLTTVLWGQQTQKWWSFDNRSSWSPTFGQFTSNKRNFLVCCQLAISFCV